MRYDPLNFGLYIYLFSSVLTIGCAIYLMIRIRENLFEEMLQEPDEVAMKRKRTRETLRVLQQAFRVSFLDMLTRWRGLSEFMAS